MRIGPDCGQPWPTDEEIREIQRKDLRPSVTVYGTHFAIRFTHKQMVPTPVLLADAQGRPSKESYERAIPLLRAVLLPHPQPCLRKAQLSVPREGIPLGWRVTYSGTREGQSKWWLEGRSVHQPIQWRRQPRNNKSRCLVQLRLL